MTDKLYKVFLKLFSVLKESYINYKKSIFLLTSLGVAENFLAGLGVTVLIPLFGLVTTDSAGEDKITMTIRSLFDLAHISFTVTNLLVLIFLLFLIKFIVLATSDYVKASVMTQYQENTMKLLFNRMIDSSWSYLSKQKIGHLENSLFVDVEYGRKALIAISRAFNMMLSIVLYAIIAFSISPTITLLTILFGTFALYLFKWSAFKIKRDSFDVKEYNKKVANYVNERTVGMKTIKAFFVDEEVKKDANLFFERLRVFRKKVLVRKKITGAIFEPISIAYILGLFYFFQARAEFNIASFAVIIFLIQRMFQYTREMQGLLYSMGESFPFLKNIIQQASEAATNKEKNIGKNKFIFERDIKFDNVSFAYEKDNLVLKEINLRVVRGEMLGVIGPSGSGKTSITDLILRLLKPTSGKIEIDGVNIQDIELGVWRNCVGYVSQDIFLIDGTIEDNIRFYDNNLTQAEVEMAAKQANIFDFINSKPDGFKTRVGERGISLSAGQRQRVAIARVLARKPKVLILDEATSALDNQSEQAIKEVIAKLKGELTIISVAHRLSTIMDCDRVVAVNNGQIIESGSPAELLGDHNSYFYKNYSI